MVGSAKHWIHLFFFVVAMANILIKSKYCVRKKWVTFSVIIWDNGIWNLLKKYPTSNRYIFMALNVYCISMNPCNLHFYFKYAVVDNYSTLLQCFCLKHQNTVKCMFTRRTEYVWTLWQPSVTYHWICQMKCELSP